MQALLFPPVKLGECSATQLLKVIGLTRTAQEGLCTEHLPLSPGVFFYYYSQLLTVVMLFRNSYISGLIYMKIFN